MSVFIIGDSKRDADDNTTDGSTHHSDSSHQFLEHSLDIADTKKRLVLLYYLNLCIKTLLRNKSMLIVINSSM